MVDGPLAAWSMSRQGIVCHEGGFKWFEMVARVLDVSGDRHESVVSLGAAGWRGDLGSFGFTTLVAADGRLSPAAEIL